MAATRWNYKSILGYFILCFASVSVAVYVFSDHKTSVEKSSDKWFTDQVDVSINVNNAISNRQDDTFLSDWSLQDGNSGHFSLANASEVGLDIGRTELEQYRQFVKQDSPMNRHKTIRLCIQSETIRGPSNDIGPLRPNRGTLSL